jgi:hypothetical protein
MQIRSFRSYSAPGQLESTRQGRLAAPMAPLPVAPAHPGAGEHPSQSAPGDFGVQNNEVYAQTLQPPMAASMPHEQHLSESDSAMLRAIFDLSQSEKDLN